jgi:hypothetical protein
VTRGLAKAQAEAILDDIFAAALRERRELTAGELMGAIGLKRTSINATYPHVNARRKAHNSAIMPSQTAPRSGGNEHEKEIRRLREMNAGLRSQLDEERSRSEQYAKVIRHLSLENYDLKHSDRRVTDARDRFGRSSKEA